MRISQHDLAQLNDNQIKAMVVGLNDVIGPDNHSAPAYFLRAVSHHLIRGLKERRRLELLAEAELMNPDEDGALVGPNDDPVADALRVMRGETP